MFKKWLLMTVMVFGLSGCGYNTMQQEDEAANGAWSEVLNQYQRRADLIPNLVNTVKAYAKHEQGVLVAVTEARAKVGQMQISADGPMDEAQLAKFQAAQGELSSSLSRLLMVSERYPDLKADANFRDLQAQLEGTENRIALARNRYIDTVRAYNTTVRSFPTNLVAKVTGMKIRPQFQVENEAAISKPVTVNFDDVAPANQAESAPAGQ
ncbi:MAG: LemA family protein [Neisseriaceae bacterium]|nr:LemA family protein [Neisseriaceae bacterium]